MTARRAVKTAEEQSVEVGSPPVIALLTDFGLSDWFVGTMKGVILGVCPTARIIDISHAVTPQSVIEGAFMLSAAQSYFPRGTIFVAVVDPGVGTRREAIIARGDGHWFIAPNNGLLGVVKENCRTWQCRKLANQKYYLPRMSTTFHARDVFAPAAAHLAAGVPWTDLAPKRTECFGLAVSAPASSRGYIDGNIIYFDHFGNAITNIPVELFNKCFRRGRAVAGIAVGDRDPAISIAVGQYVLQRISSTFADAEIGEAVAYWGSTGNLEIAVNHGSARQTLGLRLLDKVIIKRIGSQPA